MDLAKRHQLPNGLTLIHLHTPGSAVAHFGVAIRAGSGNEITPEEYGLAHFVEHTLFKGTERRSSWHIINRMEAVGGELNAFTTKQDTVVYSAFPKNALTRALDLIVDLLVNSRFPEAEINKEREVICDEINSYLDSPADAVYDDFEDILYAGTPLGHNILGTEKTVRNITSEMCRGWIRRHYTAPDMVAFYAGPVSASSFLKKAEPYLTKLPGSAKQGLELCASVSMPSTPFNKIKILDSHQAHTVMGCAVNGLDDRKRTALALVTNILGGPGMNSALNVSMREHRGLVYNVESSMTGMADTTMFTTYFGCDPADNRKCIQLVCDEISRIADGRIDARKLAGAKKQYRGQLILARANTENRIIGIARATLLHGRAIPPAETDILIDSITPEMVVDTARLLIPLSSLTLTPEKL